MGQARPCMKMPNSTSAIATLRFRQRRPAVIIESQSRQERRSSCAANQVMVPGVVMPDTQYLFRHPEALGRAATEPRRATADAAPLARLLPCLGRSSFEARLRRAPQDDGPPNVTMTSRRVLLGKERQKRLLERAAAAGLRARLAAQIVERALR